MHFCLQPVLLTSCLANMLAGTMAVCVCNVCRNWWPVMEPSGSIRFANELKDTE